ncbi:hypothetical protein EON65_46970 [archaeon]|nr:MAG: hypothetical protein EON65_46970 [archaeon]
MWEADSSWLIETGLPNVDTDGWSYSADFTSFGDSEQTGSAQKGMMHFVRRRKMVRDQCLDCK